MDQTSRTFDYELFIQTFMRAMKIEGFLDSVLAAQNAKKSTAKSGKKKPKRHRVR